MAARLALQKQQANEGDGEDKGNEQEEEEASGEDGQWPLNEFVIAGVGDDANSDDFASSAFPFTTTTNRDENFTSYFPEAGFSPPDSLSANSSDEGGESPAQSVRRTVRVPLEVDDDDDDDEMGEMVSPGVSGDQAIMDSDEEDEAFMNESLGYPNLFSMGKYKGYRGSNYEEDAEQNDSSDGEDDGLVEILVPGRKSSAGSH